MQHSKRTARIILWSSLAAVAVFSSGCQFFQSLENEKETKKWQQLRDSGSTALEEKRLTDAEKHFAAALTRAREMRITDMRLVISLNELADIYYLQKRYTDAGRLYAEISSLLDRLKEEFAPEVDPEYKIAELVHATHGLANVRREEERFSEAARLYREAFNLCKQASFVSAASRGRLSRDFSIMAERMKEKSKTSQSTQTAATMAGDKQVDEDDPMSLLRPNHITLTVGSSLEKAERMYNSFRKGPGATRVKGALALSDLGWIYYSHRKYDRGMQYLEQALYELKQVPDIPIEYLAECNMRIALAYREMYSLFKKVEYRDKAEKNLVEGLALYDGRMGPEVRHLMRNLAEIYIESHRQDKARKQLLDSLRYEARRVPVAMYDAQYGLDPQHAAADGQSHADYEFDCLDKLADLNPADAVAWANENLDRDEKVYGEKSAAVYIGLCYLAVARERAGNTLQAEEIFNQLNDFPLSRLSQGEVGMLSSAVSQFIRCRKYKLAIKLGRLLADQSGPRGFAKKQRIALYYYLGQAYMFTGDLNEALTWTEGSMELHQRYFRYDTMGSALLEELLADIAVKRGDRGAAAESLKKTAEYMQSAYADKTGNTESQLRHIDKEIRRITAKQAWLENKRG